MLHVDQWDTQAGDEVAPLVLLHGFTQSARSWGPFGESLGRGRRVLAVDLPGHGHSCDVEAADLCDAASLVAEAVHAAGVGETRFDLCGYSLGGRLALHVALADGAQVGQLVLLSATAGISNDETRAQRRAADNELAARLEQEGDVDAFLERWLAQPLFAGLSEDDAQRNERRRNTVAGLASSLRTMGTGTQQSLWDRLGALEMPTLVVTGATDVRFTRIGQRMCQALRHGVLASIPGAGHAAHLERPELAARTVGHWLDTAGAAAA